MEKNNLKTEYKTYDVLKWVYTNTLKYIPFIAFMALLGGVVSFLEVRFAFASKDLLDIATGEAGGSIYASLAFLCILLAVQLILTVVYTLIDLKLQYSVKYKYQRGLFEKLLGKRFSQLEGYHTGEISNRLNSDVTIVTTGVVNIVPNMVTLLSQLIFSLVALYKMDRTFALICIVLGGITMLVARIYSKKMKNLHKRHQLADGRIKSFMIESMQNLLVIKAFVSEKIISLKTEMLQKGAYKIAFKKNIVSLVAKVSFFIVMTLSYYFALGWCAYKISVGLMTVGTLAAILQLVGQLQTPFSDLSSLVPQYFSMVASAERIMELENLKDDVSINSREDALKLARDFKYIEFENVSFDYGDEKVFSKGNFVINKGEAVAISGPSGTGKSTMLKLMLGVIFPKEGKITFNTDSFSLQADKNTRCLFTYVPQGNMILSGTVKENVVFFSRNEDDERVRKCLEAACLWDYICTLPQGIYTTLGEGGDGLSEGQKQRLAIARALYNDAPVVLLDEATSALDEETEENVLGNIKNMGEKTAVIISHRPCALKLCTKQVVIENKSVKVVP